MRRAEMFAVMSPPRLCISAGILGIPRNPAVPAFKKRNYVPFWKERPEKLDKLQRNHQQHVHFLPECKNKAKSGLVKCFWLVLLLVC